MRWRRVILVKLLKRPHLCNNIGIDAPWIHVGFQADLLGKAAKETFHVNGVLRPSHFLGRGGEVARRREGHAVRDPIIDFGAALPEVLQCQVAPPC